MTTIDNNNYELWLLRYAEGELTGAEREAVDAWLASHPEAAEELAIYSEAPRLERDETVQYAAVPQQHTEPLWPALLRWSAAAAVLAALMLPALRMGTMGQFEPQEPLVIAAAQPQPIDSPISTNSPTSPIRPISPIKPTSPINTIPSIASVDSIPVILTIDSIHAVDTTPSFVPSTSLIVYTPAPDTLYSNNLLIYDDSRPRLRDLANEWIEDTPISKFFHHNLATRKTVLTVAYNQ